MGSEVLGSPSALNSDWNNIASTASWEQAMFCMAYYLTEGIIGEWQCPSLATVQVGVGSWILCGQLCEFVIVLPFGYFIQRCCKYSVLSELHQMHQELKWNCPTSKFFEIGYFSPSRSICWYSRGGYICFDGISSRLFCEWVGINLNAINFCILEALSCTVQNT